MPRQPDNIDLELVATIRERIEEAMAEQGYRTRAELGEHVELDGGLLGMKLNGRRKFTIEELNRISKVLNLSLHFLITGTGPRERDAVESTTASGGGPPLHPKLLQQCLGVALQHNRRKGHGDDAERITKHSVYLYHMALRDGNREQVDPSLLEIFDSLD